MLVVGAESGVQSVKDLVASASASAGKFFYASPGSGTASYLTAEQFREAVGSKARHVGYESKMESLTAVATGRAHVTGASMSATTWEMGGDRPMFSATAGRAVNCRCRARLDPQRLTNHTRYGGYAHRYCSSVQHGHGTNPCLARHQDPIGTAWLLSPRPAHRKVANVIFALISPPSRR